MNTKTQLFALRPKPYKFVGMAMGEVEDGMILHRTVSALRVPHGFIVQLYEYTSVATPSLLPQGPPPGRFTTVFLSVPNLDAVRRAFFVEGDTDTPTEKE